MSRVTVSVGEKSIELKKGTPVLDLIPKLADGTPIMAVTINNVMKSLDYIIEKDCQLGLVDLSSLLGVKVYEKTIIFVLLKAAKEVIPDAELSIEHSLGGGIYCEFSEGRKLTKYEVDKIAKIMNDIIEKDLPITRHQVSKEEAIEKIGEKSELLKWVNKDKIDIYELDGLYKYFRGIMLPSTGYVKKFSLRYYYPGFILLYPKTNNLEEPIKFNDQKKLFQVFSNYEKWCCFLDIHDVSSLNRAVRDGKIADLIKVAEAKHERDINEIAREIARNSEDIKLIILAGPSSAGKTTTSKRLRTNLMVHGLKPVTIELDNYFLDRDKTPKNSRGEYDFDSIDAIDIDLFNDNLLQLMQYKEVEIPKYNFITGKRERGIKLKIEKNNPIIIEGIHGLNEKLTHYIPQENKYKIYINALTHINIDAHNRIPTTDIRLIRRIIRDHSHRGHNAIDTLKMWKSVREGEDKNIFPYSEEADFIFNSALLYELAVLNKYALPLLKEVKGDSKVYPDAQRIIDFLELFLPIEDENPILGNSILREFIGGSIYVD